MESVAVPPVTFVTVPAPASAALMVPDSSVVALGDTVPEPLRLPALVRVLSFEAAETLHALVESIVRLSVPTAALLMKPVSVVPFCSVVEMVL